MLLRQLSDPEHYEVVLSVVGDSSSGRSGGQRVWSMYRFHYVDEQWQRDKCAQLSLPFEMPHRGRPGGPARLLTAPDENQMLQIVRDGSCLFRCFSYIITRSQRHHMLICSAVVDHVLLR